MEPPGTHTVLCWNQGSSSVKFASFALGHSGDPSIQGPAGVFTQLHGGESPTTLASLAIERGTMPRPAVIAHRIVHGGPHQFAPCRVDTEMMRSLRDVIPFAPLHLPLQIQAIEHFAQRFPEVPQIACFDTAFHRGMPDVARMFPLPRQYWDRGLLRYGFHGLSFEYVVSTLGASLGPRAIIAHLGAGSSMVALRNGASVDTTMGLTPTSGIMMGTRTGDLDPGLLLYLMRMENFTPDRLDQLVNRESGLLGVSGSTSDMKTLVERSSEDLHAAQAVDMFCLHARRQIGALTATLGGLDTLVFTGGIGEKSPQVRARICQELQFLGIALDPELNSHSEALISPPASPCTVRVLPTNEEIVLARHAADLFREWPLNCSSS